MFSFIQAPAKGYVHQDEADEIPPFGARWNQIQIVITFIGVCLRVETRR